ncbi:MAG: DUF1289 domain-containing protein [Ostreibacterium sp.]
MEQLTLFELPSPCIGVCEANNKGYCKGCLRNRQERQDWYAMNNSEKQHIMQLCHLRKQKRQQLTAQRQQTEINLPEQLKFDF